MSWRNSSNPGRGLVVGKGFEWVQAAPPMCRYPVPTRPKKRHTRWCPETETEHDHDPTLCRRKAPTLCIPPACLRDEDERDRLPPFALLRCQFVAIPRQTEMAALRETRTECGWPRSCHWQIGEGRADVRAGGGKGGDTSFPEWVGKHVIERE
jgi:hypothetical protein